MLIDTVETCPWCECDNVLSDYDVNRNGYKVKCWQCGKEIMLCNACREGEDNPSVLCDWRGTIKGGRSYGRCFRGKTDNKEDVA